MGTPAIPSEADRLEAVRLADLVLSQIEADEALPIIGDNRAWLLAAEITELRDEAEENERTWRETFEALQGRILIADTLKDELLVKLQVQERAEARGREERDARILELEAGLKKLVGDRDAMHDRAMAAEGRLEKLIELVQVGVSPTDGAHGG